MEASYDLHVRGDDLPPPLRPYVHECYEIGLDLVPGQTARFPVSATTDPALNVTLSGTVTIRLGTAFRLPPVTLAGPQPDAYQADVAGEVRGFYVRFATVGPLVLLGVEDYSLTHRGARPLHEMVRPDLRGAARVLEDRLLTAPTFTDRVELTTRFLLDHRREPDPRATLVQAAVQAIDRAGGNLRIAELARRLGTGESTLRRHFAVLGMSPKRFAAIVRFRRAHAYLHTTERATWRDAITRFGYADQAHFVREYRRFSGTSPTRWDPRNRSIDRRMGIEAYPAGPR
jgi:AraC-like DNA-binding protein